MAPRVSLVLGVLLVAAAGASLGGGAGSSAGAPPESSAVTATDPGASTDTGAGTSEGGDDGEAAETYTSADPDKRVAPPSKGARGVQLSIPRIGLTVPIVEGTDDAALAQGVGHWENETLPGDRGNYVLAGHRVTHGEPFADLPELRPGDRVTVTAGDYRYVYEMDTRGDEYRVNDNDLWVVKPMPKPMRGGPDRILTLITCAETFHTDDRFIAFGHLVKINLVK